LNGVKQTDQQTLRGSEY